MFDHFGVQALGGHGERGSGGDLHGHVLRHFVEGFGSRGGVAAGLHFHEYGKLAVGVQIATDQAGLAGGEFHLGELAEAHVFAGGGDNAIKSFLHGNGGVGHERSGEQRFGVSVFALGDLSHHVFHEALELVAASHEVGFALDFDGHAGLAVGGQFKAHETFGGGAAGLLGGLGKTLLAEPVDGLFHVAVAFRKGFLAVHHARGGLFAQVFNHSSSDAHENLRKTLVIRRRLRQRGLLQPWLRRRQPSSVLPRRPCSWNPCAWLRLRGRLRPWR